ncbi:hypothetical protein R1sor_018048 [Riccia sorocarpa]|uniref:Holliday junction resolvase n=1 Tax=Riccia sorocarpa TaxID=122646 RepID=A0ABD3I905_9MARC
MKAVTLRQLREAIKGGGRLLGMDVGVRNVDVAISDHGCRIAFPHSVLYRNQSTNWRCGLVLPSAATNLV